MFENGSFLRRRKRFKLQAIDKEILEKINSGQPLFGIGGIPSSQPSPNPNPPGMISSPPMTTLSPPIPTNPSINLMSPQYNPHQLNLAHQQQFHHSHHGGFPSNLAAFMGTSPHPALFLNGDGTEARLLAAAAAAGYSPPARDLYPNGFGQHTHQPRSHSPRPPKISRSVPSLAGPFGNSQSHPSERVPMGTVQMSLEHHL